jgi:hypothetical protein
MQVHSALSLAAALRTVSSAELTRTSFSLSPLHFEIMVDACSKRKQGYAQEFNNPTCTVQPVIYVIWTG